MLYYIYIYMYVCICVYIYIYIYLCKLIFSCTISMPIRIRYTFNPAGVGRDPTPRSSAHSNSTPRKEFFTISLGEELE